MSPWPGTPKSQQTPAINPPSQRSIPKLHEGSTMTDVARAVNTAFNGLTVHEQAFANLPAQIAAQASAAASAAVQNITNETVTGVTSFNAQVGAIFYFPGLGYVNNELGIPNYTPVQGDAGSKIIMGDSSPVTVTLNPAMTVPWFAFIGNDSSSTVSLVPDSGAVVNGLTEIYPGGLAVVFLADSTFWSEGYPGGATGTINIPSVDSGMTGTITVVNGAIISFVNAT